MPKAMIVVVSEGPRRATNTMANKRPGNAIQASIMRDSKASLRPPRNPATRPELMPGPAEIRIAPRQVSRARRAPYTTEKVAPENVSTEKVPDTRRLQAFSRLNEVRRLGRDHGCQHSYDDQYGNNSGADRKRRCNGFPPARSSPVQFIARMNPCP